MSTAPAPMYEWKDLPWHQIERKVFKLQKRIYQATRRGDVKAVHRLQRLLTKSWSSKCLAVRRVTQDNQGKRTAGVDRVKSLTPPQRLGLVRKLKLHSQPRPVRRVWIPKPGSNEKRPLGIATLHDRALQTLVKLALEPEWEAKFEPNSYGFRPGRSCHDAVAAIFLAINKQPRYVLDADIAKCFDRINHKRLLEKLATYPTLRRLVKAWLQIGVLDGDQMFPTPEGVPQGGPLSPLLANVALHGLDTAILSAFPARIKQDGKSIRWQPSVCRYADDFVVLHRDQAAIADIQKIVSQWLADMGLELKPSKTRITHTLTEHEGAVGLDFLGFHIQQYPVGKTHSGCNQQGELLGFKTIIRPSAEAIHRHSQAIREAVRRYSNAPQASLIARLNPLIRGWTNYYAAAASSRTFSKLAHLTYLKLRRWAKRRHPNWSSRQVIREYWRLETGHWDFGTRDGTRLYQHWQTPIVRHAKVIGTKSPYDGDWVYWATRLGRHPELPKRVAVLLRRQEGKCAWCGLYFRDEDLPELDHIAPRTRGGRDSFTNWQLLHRHCHDMKTARDKLAVLNAHDMSLLAEEPDAGKPACPVLKPSGRGDPGA
jgi:RNA-directed DNA polymerase